MELGHLIDYVIEYNQIHQMEDSETDKKEDKGTTRMATQADWDALCG